MDRLAASGNGDGAGPGSEPRRGSDFNRVANRAAGRERDPSSATLCHPSARRLSVRCIDTTKAGRHSVHFSSRGTASISRAAAFLPARGRIRRRVHARFRPGAPGRRSRTPEPRRARHARSLQHTGLFARLRRAELYRLGGAPLDLRVRGQHYEYPQEDFFGFGQDSQEDDRTNYLLTKHEGGADAAMEAVSS